MSRLLHVEPNKTLLPLVCCVVFSLFSKGLVAEDEAQVKVLEAKEKLREAKENYKAFYNVLVEARLETQAFRSALQTNKSARVAELSQTIRDRLPEIDVTTGFDTWFKRQRNNATYAFLGPSGEELSKAEVASLKRDEYSKQLKRIEETARADFLLVAILRDRQKLANTKVNLRAKGGQTISGTICNVAWDADSLPLPVDKPLSPDPDSITLDNYPKEIPNIDQLHIRIKSGGKTSKLFSTTVLDEESKQIVNSLVNAIYLLDTRLIFTEKLDLLVAKKVDTELNSALDALVGRQKDLESQYAKLESQVAAAESEVEAAERISSGLAEYKKEAMSKVMLFPEDYVGKKVLLTKILIADPEKTLEGTFAFLAKDDKGKQHLESVVISKTLLKNVLDKYDFPEGGGRKVNIYGTVAIDGSVLKRPIIVVRRLEILGGLGQIVEAFEEKEK